MASKKGNAPRILLWDIETKPNVSYTWGKWQTDVLDFIEEWSILSVAYKWFGEKKVYCLAVDTITERALIKYLHRVFKKADILIAHHGDSFDLKRINARFLYYGLNPPKIPATIDTKKVAKRYFYFNSNSLNDLGKHLGLGEKVKHTGFSLWKGCMSGDRKSWAMMKRYNRQDVVLLEKVYQKFLPYIQNHPNLSAIKGVKEGCPNCSSQLVHREGIRANHRALQQQWHCNACGSWYLTPLRGLS